MSEPIPVRVDLAEPGYKWPGPCLKTAIPMLRAMEGSVCPDECEAMDAAMRAAIKRRGYWHQGDIVVALRAMAPAPGRS